MTPGEPYAVLADVYEWLVPDALLTPEGSAAAFDAVVDGLPVGSRVLDCACGTGQLAVGLALAGFDVTASDVSDAMVGRTRELAAAHDADVQVMTCGWESLCEAVELHEFDLVLCVGNSLAHAAGGRGRRRALAQMAAVLRPGGRLAVTSRNWELIRGGEPGITVADRIARRHGRAGVVVHCWHLAPDWDDEHQLDVAVALLGPSRAVTTRTERLSFWPFTHGTLSEDLRASGLVPDTSTYEADADRYLVTARKPSAS